MTSLAGSTKYVNISLTIHIYPFYHYTHAQRNGTSWADGTLRMHTGEGDMDRLGDIVTWNGRNRTHAYPGPCGALTGSADGLLAPGKLKTGDKFDIWSTDTCR